MHALDAHIYSKYFRKFILAIQTQRTPLIDIIDHRLISPLLGISKLHYAHRVTRAIDRSRNSLSSCSQLSIDSSSKSIYQSKAFPLSEQTNCFTRRPLWVPTFSQVSTKWAMCCLGFPLPSNCKNLGGWYPFGILMLLMCFVWGFEYVRELVEKPLYCARMLFIIMSCNCRTDNEAIKVEEPLYCARMLFIIMSCNCWTDNEAIEVDCSHRGMSWFSFPLSSFVEVVRF